MKKIEVLGTGCPKCVKLANAVCQAADELGLETSRPSWVAES